MNISDINFGIFTESELRTIIDVAKDHIEKRKAEPETIISIVRFEDGSEGVNCYLHRFRDIPAEELKKQIWLWVNRGGVDIKLVEIEKQDYLEYEAQYNWFEEDQPKMDWEDDDEDDEK